MRVRHVFLIDDGGAAHGQHIRCLPTAHVVQGCVCGGALPGSPDVILLATVRSGIAIGRELQLRKLESKSGCEIHFELGKSQINPFST